jgi:hypothetical protein
MAMNLSTVALHAVVAVVALAFSADPAAANDIVVTNFKDGQTIRYTTPLLIGTLTDATAQTITVVNESSKRDTREMTGQAYKGRFKALTDLVQGENRLVLTAGGKSSRFKLIYKPQTNSYIFRAVYITDKTGDTRYDDPKGAKCDAVGKLGTAMLLMQSFSAEAMNDKGFGRKTFNIELDKNGRCKVYVVKGPQEPGAWEKNGIDGSAIAKAIHDQAGKDNASYLVVLGKGCGYTAVGGEGTALFGGKCIYSWPSSIKEAQAAFMDTTPIDGAKFHIDSSAGNVYWGNTSTCLGACLHEIVHTFGVPHSMDGFCVMTRGFDYFSRRFTLVQAPATAGGTPTEFKSDEEARFCDVTAANVSCARQFALDARPYARKGNITIKYDVKRDVIVAEAELGIRFLGLEVPYADPGADYCVKIDPNKPAPKKIVVQAKEWDRFNGKPFQVRVIDSDDHCIMDRQPLRDKAK